MRPSPDLLYVLLVNRGGMNLRAGQLDEAIADLEAAIKLKDIPYHAHALLAQIISSRAGWTRPKRLSTAPSSGSPPAPSCSGPALCSLPAQWKKTAPSARNLTPSQRARAIRDLEQAIRLEPRDSPQKADDHAELGRLFFASGKTVEALAAYDNALLIAPDDLKALRLRTLALLEQERYDEVLAACDAYLANGKPSADLLEIRGQARLARKDFSGAISDYTVALSLNPDSATLHNRRGWAYLLADAFKLALTDFDRAIALDAGLGHAYSGRGLARVSVGNWREAVADVDTAVKLATMGLKQQSLYNAARVHALASRYAGEEASRRGEPGLVLYRRLRERARRFCSSRCTSFRLIGRPASGAKWSPLIRYCGRSFPRCQRGAGILPAEDRRGCRQGKGHSSHKATGNRRGIACIEMGKNVMNTSQRRANLPAVSSKSSRQSGNRLRYRLRTPPPGMDGRPDAAVDVYRVEHAPTAALGRCGRRSSIPTPRPARRTRSTSTSRARACRRSRPSRPCPRSRARS